MGTIKLDWIKIKSEYVTQNISYRKLADKYGVAYTTLANYARKDEWTKARDDYKIKTTSKVLERCMNIEARKETDKLRKMKSSAEKLSDIIEKSLNDAEQFNRHIVQTKKKDGPTEEWDAEERIYKKLDTRAIKDMTSAMKDLTSMLRNVYDLQTIQEIQSHKLAQDKLALDREKASLFDDDEDDTGVVMLAPAKEDTEQSE